METFNIHDAKTHLSKIVERASKGECFVIAKAGKPLVKIVPLDDPVDKPKVRIGFLKGVYAIPDDLKSFGRDEIEEMFYGPKA